MPTRSEATGACVRGFWSLAAEQALDPLWIARSGFELLARSGKLNGQSPIVGELVAELGGRKTMPKRQAEAALAALSFTDLVPEWFGHLSEALRQAGVPRLAFHDQDFARLMKVAREHPLCTEAWMRAWGQDSPQWLAAAVAGDPRWGHLAGRGGIAM